MTSPTQDEAVTALLATPPVRAQKQPHTCCVGGQSRDGVTRHLSQQTSRGARAALPTSRPLLVPLTPCYPPPPPVSSTTFTLPSRERPSWSLPLPSGDHLYPPSLNNEVQDAHSPQAIQPHPAPAGWQADDCWFDSYGVVYVGLAPDVAVGESVPTSPPLLPWFFSTSCWPASSPFCSLLLTASATLVTRMSVPAEYSRLCPQTTEALASLPVATSSSFHRPRPCQVRVPLHALDVTSFALALRGCRVGRL
eukprot:contig_6486_g1478